MKYLPAVVGCLAIIGCSAILAYIVTPHGDRDQNFGRTAQAQLEALAHKVKTGTMSRSTFQQEHQDALYSVCPKVMMAAEAWYSQQDKEVGNKKWQLCFTEELVADEKDFRNCLNELNMFQDQKIPRTHNIYSMFLGCRKTIAGEGKGQAAN